MGYSDAYANNVAAIYRDLGRSQAEAKLRAAGAWAGAIGEIGQAVAGIPGALADQKRADQQSQILERNLAQLAKQDQRDQWLADAMNSSVVNGQIDERRLTENLSLMGAAELVPEAVKVIRESAFALQQLQNAQQQGQINEAELRGLALNYFKPFAKAIKEANFDPGVVNGALSVVALQAGQEEADRLRQSFAADPGALTMMVESVLVPERPAPLMNVAEGAMVFDPNTGQMVAENPKPEGKKSLEDMMADAIARKDGAEVSRLRNEMMRNAAATRAPQAPRVESRSWVMDPATGKEVFATDSEIISKGYQRPATADMRNKESGKAVAAKAVDAVRKLGDGIFTKVGPAQRATAIKRGAEAVFGNDPEFRTYQDSRMALAGTLAVEQQGSRVSDADVRALWLPMVPDAYRDTKESYKLKWDLIDAMRGVDNKAAGKTGPTAEELIKKYGGG